MKKNIGSVDSAIRSMLVILLGLGAAQVGISTSLGLLLGIVALVLFVTVIAGFCPIYTLLNISTNKPSSNHSNLEL